jgi:hypothetical protein
MTWETRGRGRYLYRSERVGDRVVKRYVGRGESALHIAAEAAEARRQRSAEKIAADLLIAELAPLAALMKGLDREVESRVALELQAGGWHRHHGIWRKRRGI